MVEYFFLSMFDCLYFKLSWFLGKINQPIKLNKEFRLRYFHKIEKADKIFVKKMGG